MGTLSQGGIPRKLTKRFLKSFKKLVVGGVPPIHAAQVLGVHRSTFYEWLRWANNDDPAVPVHSSIRDLRDILEEGRSEAIAQLILKANARIASTSDALRLLAKIAPDEFGDRPEEKSDLTINQIIIGMVKEMRDRQAAISAEAGIIEAEFKDDDLEI